MTTARCYCGNEFEVLPTKRVMARPQTENPNRITTGIRFDPALKEALAETADELGVSVNWLVVRFCTEGLENMDLEVLRGRNWLRRPG